MKQEKVFELVRREDVALWIGSGFSLNAGYPPANGLIEILYNSLTKQDQAEINKNSSLLDFSEEFVRIKHGSRNQLIQVLNSIFSKQAKTLKYHKLVAEIPHIKTIITTNYDNLFEEAYGGKAVKIKNSIDISYTDRNKVEIFKVHGDFSIPDSIIITRSDYNNLFQKNFQNDLFWVTIMERISNKAIVFIGYGLEDSNFEVLFKKLNETLGNNRKEAFLVAPDLKRHKVDHLTKMNVQHIDSKGEIFIRKLYEDIKMNIRGDLENGLVSLDTFSRFMNNYKMEPNVKVTDDNKRKLVSISSTTGKLRGKFSFRLNEQSELKNHFEEIITGKRFGNLEISDSNVEELKFTMNSINLLPHDRNNHKFFIQSQPYKKGLADIIFEDDFEISDVSYELFGSKHLSELQLRYKNSQLSIKYKLENNPLNEINFKYTQLGNVERVTDAINFYSALKKILEGEKLKVWLKGETKATEWKHFTKQSKPLDKIDYFLNYYSILNKIEKLKSVRFHNISFPTKDYYERMRRVLDFAEGNPKTTIWDHVGTTQISEIDNESIQYLDLIQKGGNDMFITFQDKEEVEIHGLIFTLGYKVVIIHQPHIKNYDQVISGKETEVQIISKNKQMTTVYYDEPIDLTKSP